MFSRKKWTCRSAGVQQEACIKTSAFTVFELFGERRQARTGATGRDQAGRRGLGFGRPPWDLIQDLIHLRPFGPYVFDLWSDLVAVDLIAEMGLYAASAA